MPRDGLITVNSLQALSECRKEEGGRVTKDQNGRNEEGHLGRQWGSAPVERYEREQSLQCTEREEYTEVCR